MIIEKITTGFVIQTYDTDAKVFVSQEFVAGDQVEWENESGEPLDLSDIPTNDYLPFDMIQP